jgi:hypothetical protein
LIHRHSFSVKNLKILCVSYTGILSFQASGLKFYIDPAEKFSTFFIFAGKRIVFPPEECYLSRKNTRKDFAR